MRIAYASDLHLEFGGPLTLTVLSHVDVLVLAGDVDTLPKYDCYLSPRRALHNYG
jgi:hypothetical protein